MKKSLILLIVAILIANINQVKSYNELTVELARMFSKDIFDYNGVEYMKPMVHSINATSNSRFFNQAFVPKKVDKPYFRVGVHSMLGFVRDDQKMYSPRVPTEPLNMSKLATMVDIDWSNPFDPKVKAIHDTSALIYYAFKTILWDAQQQGKITVPDEAATVLGNKHAVIVIPRGSLDSVIMNHPVYPFLPKEFQDTLLNVVGQFPWHMSLPMGGNMNTLFAAVPQFEIGSLWGTELLIRLIPPIDMGENIGDFAFWGVGLKHSISQYFNDDFLDIAAQVVYQGTYLNNKIGVTNAELKAIASIWNANLHLSKRFDNILDLYSGISFEFLNINSDFKYYLPIETQAQLGLIRTTTTGYLPDGSPIQVYHEPEPPEYPGDTKPQTTKMTFTDNNVKFIFGVAKQIGPINIFVDYSFSKFNIFSGGIEYRF